MITLPSDVLSEPHDPANNGDDAIGYAWDGKHEGHDNKQTSMDWAEHQRIVCEAVGLLGDGTFGGEMEGTHNYISGAVRAAFKELYAAYTRHGKSEVRVSKGIHQPTVDPHLQLRTSTQHGSGPVLHHKFHLNVSAEPLANVDGMAAGRFQWKPVQFSVAHGDQAYRWPRVAAISPKDRHTNLRARRLSISTVDLQAHMDDLAEKQAAADKAEQEAKALAAKQQKADTFDSALAAFLDQHGGKTRKIAATQGVFPSDKFKNGTSTARVQVGGGVATIKYDRGTNLISKV
jgi:hypothetical protein